MVELYDANDEFADSEDAISRFLGDALQSLDRSSQDLELDSNDVFTEGSVEVTDSESISTGKSGGSKSHRMHPFWSKTRNGKSSFDKTNQKYLEMLRGRQSLPSFAMKDEFLEVLRNDQVLVVTGETGCG
jgi:ATP-dependent RNA helicase DHX29